MFSRTPQTSELNNDNIVDNFIQSLTDYTTYSALDSLLGKQQKLVGFHPHLTLQKIVASYLQSHDRSALLANIPQSKPADTAKELISELINYIYRANKTLNLKGTLVNKILIPFLMKNGGYENNFAGARIYIVDAIYAATSAAQPPTQFPPSVASSPTQVLHYVFKKERKEYDRSNRIVGIKESHKGTRTYHKT